MKTIYICIPMPVFCERTQRKKADYWQKHFEQIGYTVINPFELRDQLEKCHHLIAKCDPMEPEYKRERMCNLEFSDKLFLCSGWAHDADCMDEVDQGIKCGLKFEFQQYENKPKY